MNHLNFKSISFYGVAIFSVLLLFKTVTNYGENNLKAPPYLKESYSLKFGEKLSDCNQPDTVILDIHQSGVYLNGVLLPTNLNYQQMSTLKEHSTLNGRYKNQNISLSGHIPNYILCKNTDVVDKKAQRLVNLQMQIEKQDNLTGQMSISGINKPIKVSAVPQKNQDNSANLNSH
ncbi:MAG: hypothetical protein C6Y22_15680 [Hapalosiphonaceae cyanobacterium JJU2]|nr:MAG: hypothetical protein C6Y22_15680 [Hapalosiphonaceae cyanobacterium JJU2]